MTGPLKNPKHERFAQELAKGKTQIESYVKAGFKPNDSAAARLFGNVRIRERVADLQARVAKRTEITVAGITQKLLNIARKGEALKEAPGLSVARAALMDAAKLNGLAPERHEFTGKNGGPIEYANLSDEELEARIEALKKPNGSVATTH